MFEVDLTLFMCSSTTNHTCQKVPMCQSHSNRRWLRGGAPCRAPAGKTEQHHRPSENTTDSPPPAHTDARGTLTTASAGPGTDLRHKHTHIMSRRRHTAAQKPRQLHFSLMSLWIIWLTVAAEVAENVTPIRDSAVAVFLSNNTSLDCPLVDGKITGHF